MDASTQFRAGLKRAVIVTGISPRQASLRAGFNEGQLNRFINGSTNIKLDTLDAVCTEGFGMKFDTVYRMGE